MKKNPKDSLGIYFFFVASAPLTFLVPRNWARDYRQKA